ncbi:glycosyltransferase family 2 protein [Methylicorpusculum sp.]|uniref:glycosyltransferase family 2 protein n=2 Tax=Methylicorpusculum sp. TaxID=2713644 RepID=UPI0027318C67|nr:glycosyltransferase family 2 protein [Methylicorpusculum sp.]MDP2178675.1 glycosyltransferase family 2 protein [Methylicorpusculum sp.]MDP3529560.1 glycosyltransferase family 2 protein [Methylicorpusculum sp.]
MNSMISILMPAKNVAHFIRDAIQSLEEPSKKFDFELIVVEDHSEDNTLDVLHELAGNYNFLKVFVNPGRGKIDALNHAYACCNGHYVKTIDADDVFLPGNDFLDFFDSKFDTIVHSATIVNENKSRLGNYIVNNRFLKDNKTLVISSLVSLPRWSFSFSRAIADHIFPIPSEMAYEDVWMSAVIKIRALSIKLIDQTEVYLYRQHNTQAFGGILSANRNIFKQRAGTLLTMIDYMSQPDIRKTQGWENADFSKVRKYYGYLLAPNFWVLLIDHELNITSKIKLILHSYIPLLIPVALRCKWTIDRFNNAKKSQAR